MDSKTFVVVASEVSGTTPTQSRFPTITDGKTIFRSDRGRPLTAAAFFTYLAATPSATVEVKGSLNTSSQILARIVKIEDDSNDGGWEDGSHNGGDDRGGGDDHGNSGRQ
ncbi:MAG: hypothetical protein QM758_25570 [Armatimonas sp.]